MTMLKYVYNCDNETNSCKGVKVILPIERQNCIRKLLQKNKSMKISDLSKKFSVSEMTIHRDLKPLLDEGLVTKTFGGVMLSSHDSDHGSAHCIYCNRTLHEKLTYRLILANNNIEIACCAHCGFLRHRQLEDQVVQSICHDFLRSTTISAQHAWYVMDTTLDIGCCQPQVLPFEWEKHAQQFVKGFGGIVYPFEKAMEMVFKKMNLPSDA